MNRRIPKRLMNSEVLLGSGLRKVEVTKRRHADISDSYSSCRSTFTKGKGMAGEGGGLG